MVDQSGTYGTPRLELGAAAMEYVINEAELIGNRVMPIFGTPKKAANYPAITRESISNIPDAKRSVRGNYNRVGFETEDRDYSCDEFGLEGPLGEDERALYANDFDAEMMIVQTTMWKLLLVQEIRVAAKIFSTSIFTGADLYTDNSGNPWDDITKDIIGQVRAAVLLNKQNCGIKPNAIVMNDTNINRCKANTAIIDAIKYTSRTTDEVLMNALADLFGLPEVIVAGGIKNSAKKKGTWSGSEIWSDDYIFIGRIATDGMNLAQPSVARQFLWTEDSPQNPVVESYEEKQTRSSIFRVRHQVDEVIVDPYFGHLMKVDA